jgi:hypothetical protein
MDLTAGNFDQNGRKHGSKLQGIWIKAVENMDQNCREFGSKL